MLAGLRRGASLVVLSFDRSGVLIGHHRAFGFSDSGDQIFDLALAWIVGHTRLMPLQRYLRARDPFDGEQCRPHWRNAALSGHSCHCKGDCRELFTGWGLHVGSAPRATAGRRSQRTDDDKELTSAEHVHTHWSSSQPWKVIR